MTDVPIDPQPPTHQQLYNSACVTLNLARSCYTIWMGIDGKAEQDREAIARVPTYLKFVAEAAKRTLVVSLFSLYDTYDGDVLTINRLIQPIEAGEHRRKLDRSYRAVHAVKNKLAILRHGLFAHRNATKHFNDLYREAQLRPADINRLLTQTYHLLLEISQACDYQEPVLDPYVETDMRDLYAMLKTGQRRVRESRFAIFEW